MPTQRAQRVTRRSSVSSPQNVPEPRPRYHQPSYPPVTEAARKRLLRARSIRAIAKRAGLHVLQSHGRMDPILPFAGGEYLRDLLKGSGLEVEWIPFGGGHAIPDGVLERLGPFVAEVSAPA